MRSISLFQFSPMLIQYVEDKIFIMKLLNNILV